VPVAAGDLLHFVTWGGGGWGDPLLRDPGLVLKEVVQGLVTIQGARQYGVVITGEPEGALELDDAATAALRETLRAAGGVEGLFDRGGSIEELRARCEAETGLPAPRPPVWVTHRNAA